jgi:hypothetical protein
MIVKGIAEIRSETPGGIDTRALFGRCPPKKKGEDEHAERHHEL